MLLTKAVLVSTVTVTVVASAAVLAGSAVADPVIAGTYNTVTPTRVLDTRAGTGAPKAQIPARGTLTFDAVGTLSTKLVSAEALTITVVNPASAGFVVAYPGGSDRPGTSTVNFAANHTTANSAIVPYASAGAVTLYNGSTKPVDVLADFSGYWTGGSVADDTDGAYNPVSTSRLIDTRTSQSPIAPGADLAVDVAGEAGVPDADANLGAVVVNVTTPTPAAAGFLTATAAPDDQDGATSRTSDVSFTTRQTASDLVVVPVDPDTGAFTLHNGSTAPVNVAVDIVGYFTGGTPSDDGAAYISTPYRNSDTRDTAPVAGKATVKSIVVPGADTSLFKAVVATFTETGGSQAGFLTAWNGSSTRPGTSVLNFVPKQAVSVTAIVPLNADGTISIYNGSTGSANVIVDVHGFVINDLSGDAQAQARLHTVLTHARSNAATRLAS